MNGWMSLTIMISIMLSILGSIIGVRTIRRLRLMARGRSDAELPTPMPMAMLQTRAMWNLVVTTLGIAVLFLMFAGQPITEFFWDARYGGSLTLVIMIVIIINAIMMAPTGKKGKWARLLDERDEVVLALANQWQIIGLVILSIIWTIGLTETYWDSRSIPITFPYLMFWSNLLMLSFSRSLGIIYGYWWLNHYGN